MISFFLSLFSDVSLSLSLSLFFFVFCVLVSHFSSSRPFSKKKTKNLFFAFHSPKPVRVGKKKNRARASRI